MKNTLQRTAIIILAILLSNAGYCQVNRPNISNFPGSYNTFQTAYYPSPSFGSLTGVNYIRERYLRLPYTGSTSALVDITYNYPLVSSIIGTTYLNGWGQPLQHNLRGALGMGTKDIITVFDQRPSLTKYKLLAYPSLNQSIMKINPYGEQQDYYMNYPEWSNESGYGFTKERVSANNGIVYNESYSPGMSFTGGDVGTTGYTTYNQTTDYIRLWTMDGNGNPATFSSYAGSELQVKHSEGQHNSNAKEYYDKNNQLVCKQVKSGNDWLTTVYIYDEQGRLCWIIPPKAYATYTGGASITLAARENLCFHYTYDKYGNVISRKIPDRTGIEETVYDKKFRPVLLQTPLLKAEGKWIFNIYDSRDRMVVSGTVTSNATRQDWQDWVNGTSNPPAFGTNILSNEVLLDHLRNQHRYADHNLDGYPNALYGPPAVANGAGVVCEINRYNYYDAYDKSPDLVGRTYDTRFINSCSSGSYDVLPVPHLFTQGLLTGSMVRIISDNKPNNFANQWIGSVYFYDEKGRVIQAQVRNPWTTNSAEWDIYQTQYSFLGETRHTMVDHFYPVGSAPKTHTTLQKTNVSVPGTTLLQSVRLQADNGLERILANYTYDSFARVRKKVIGGIEEQNYRYNIRGQIKSINADYVSSGTASDDITFGCVLSYDYGFDMPRFDGGISGMTWRGSGTSNPRAYGYKYDDLGRITGADFNEYNYGAAPGMGIPLTPWWNKYIDDYTVSGISYDANGNMQSLLQKGMWYNPSTSKYEIVDMDRLAYTYNSTSNMLDRVEDTTTINYHLHDFFNGNNGSTDYAYDADANLIADKNKGIDSIVYNYQDLPVHIVKDDTCIIDNIYDAGGTLLQKTITIGSATPTVYTYCGDFVYRNDTLEYFLHDEGRCRWLADSNFFKFDYFIKDHLGNVRSVVTADPVYTTDPLSYRTDLELSSRDDDRLIFDHIDQVSAIKPQGGPGDVMAGELDGDDPDKRVGAAILLQVMAGDKFNASVQSYYEENNEPNTYLTDETMLGSLLEAVSGSINPAAGEEGAIQNYINSMLTTDNYAAFSAIRNNITDPAYPHAYLNYMLFDNDFNLLHDGSGAVQLDGSAFDWTIHTVPDIAVKRNGYLLIYVSREAPGVNWFDAVHISHYKGRLLEEQHYYPHGLVVHDGGESTTPLKNKYLYQGKLLQDELGLELYDFHARQYDPQIGRFWSVDPADQFPSGYTGMGNDPANMIDPTGMWVANAGYDGGYHETGAKDEREGPGDGMGNVSAAVNFKKNDKGEWVGEFGVMDNESLEFYSAGGSGAAGGDPAPGGSDNDDNFRLNDDGTVTRTEETNAPSHSFYNSHDMFLFSIGADLAPRGDWDQLDPEFQKEVAWSIPKVGLAINNDPYLEKQMFQGADRVGWNATPGINELKRLGRHTSNMLMVDFVSSFAKTLPTPSQSSREGRATGLTGIIIGSIDAGYSAFSGGRDLQYDVTHPVNTALYMKNSGIGLYNRFMNGLSGGLSSFNNWRPMYVKP